ncbi:uncharacterized protein V6R79_015142 [Siganus canaliculatus]
MRRFARIVWDGSQQTSGTERPRWSAGLTAADSMSQRSLQRAETLLKSTLNPSLKWLFYGHSQDEEEEEEEEEGNFVVAYNLASRSSARLLHLQQALLTPAPQWHMYSEAPMGSVQVCVKGLPGEGGVLLLPSAAHLRADYRSLWRLLEQRSLLLFKHEYIRRARMAAAYISRVSHLLEDQLKEPHLTRNQSASRLVASQPFLAEPRASAASQPLALSARKGPV